MGHTRAYPAIGGSGGGATDHGALAGLADDDHRQYLLRADIMSAVINGIVTDIDPDGRPFVVIDSGNVVFNP